MFQQVFSVQGCSATPLKPFGRRTLMLTRKGKVMTHEQSSPRSAARYMGVSLLHCRVSCCSWLPCQHSVLSRRRYPCNLQDGLKKSTESQTSCPGPLIASRIAVLYRFRRILLGGFLGKKEENNSCGKIHMKIWWAQTKQKNPFCQIKAL